MPGGVNSPVRAFKSVEGEAPIISHGKGSKIYDIDGNEYIDYVLGFGPNILGHSPPLVIDELKKKLEQGTTYGATNSMELELAKLILEKFDKKNFYLNAEGEELPSSCSSSSCSSCIMPSLPSLEKDLHLTSSFFSSSSCSSCTSSCSSSSCSKEDNDYKIRFTSTGTEACITMLRLVRAYTNKNKIIKFSGHYHGFGDSYLKEAGSGLATLSLKDTSGIPSSYVKDTLIGEFNNLDSIKKLINENKNEIGGIILEPIMGNSGFILPKKEFLVGLKQLCKENNILLVFDEVMVGYRIKYGPTQQYYNIQSDITTLGKIIGGGMPVGAVVGRKEIMNLLAPQGPVYQAGTFSGNPIGMAAGVYTLKMLKELDEKKNIYKIFDKKTSYLMNELKKLAEKYNFNLNTKSLGSMFGFFFMKDNKKTVDNYQDAKSNCDANLFGKFHKEMIKNGVYLPPSQYEACFISSQHSDEDIQKTLDAAEKSFQTLSNELKKN